MRADGWMFKRNNATDENISIPQNHPDICAKENTIIRMERRKPIYECT